MHAGGPFRDAGVDEPGVAARQLVRIVAALLRAFAHFRVAQIRKIGVVELQVGAASLTERADFGLVALRHVGEKVFHVRVGLAGNRAAAAAEMQHGGRRDRNFRRARGHRLEKFEILELDRLHVPELAGDMQHRWGEIHVADRAPELDRDAAAHFHPFKLLEEIDVEKCAPELAVGDAVQAPVLLHAHDLANRSVFDLPQRGRVDLAFLASGARLEEFLGAQETAHVIGPERRSGALGHCV